jgi:superfamily I DNA/RNA helicase/RecB family exonuclease
VHSLRVGPFPALESALGEQIAALKRRLGPLAPVIIVVPTALLRLHLRRKLASHINLRFLTFADVVREAASDFKPLPLFADELIAENVIADKVCEGDYFHPVKGSTGFRQCLLATIRDLKEAGIAPRELGRAATATGLPEEKFVQLAALYAGYEESLRSHGASDDADTLAAAVKDVAGGGWRVAGVEPKEAIFYGFYDFNHLQRLLLAALAKHCSLSLYVPWHDEKAFDFAQPTVEWLEKLLKAKRAVIPHSALRIPQLCVVSAPGEARECREIFREALAFAVNGKRPLHEVAVLARGDEPYGPLLGDLAAARGWPLHLAMGRAPLEAVEPRLLLLLLDIAANDFPRSKVMEFAVLSPATSRLAAEWDRLSAELGIVAGANVWRDRIHARARQLQVEQSHPDETKAAVAAHQSSAIRELEGFIEMLRRVAQRVPKDGKWSDFTAAAVMAAKELLPETPEGGRALDQLRALDALDDYRAAVSCEEFARYARKAFETARQPEGGFQEGGPFVGGIMAARGVSWPMVVVPGLVEKSWPRQLREDPILLDEERRALNKRLASGDDLLRVEEKVARGRDEERMLFRLACDAATERLVISFPRIEPASGRPRVPSALLLDTLGVPNFTVLEKDRRVRKVPLTPLAPPEGVMLDAGEFDYRLLEDLRSRGIVGVKPILDAMSPTLAPGVLLERMRWSGGRWTEYDGCLARPESLEALRRLFDPAKHRWAISRLEAYARCPFSFFLREVLGVEQLDEPEGVKTISALDFGSLFHELLSNIIRRFQMGNLLPLDPARAVENELVLDDEAGGALAEFTRRGVTGYPLVWRVKQEKISADLHRWLQLEYGHAASGFCPVATEWSFGREGDPPPAQLKLDEKATLFVAGQIDRVDRGPSDEVFVLDYKTSGPKSYRNGSFCRARALQIPVYMLATEQSGGKTCGGGAYYFATERGGFEKRGWVREELAAAEPRLREILGGLLRSILAGKFFITPDGADAAGTAMTRAAVEALWEMKSADLSIADYLDATAEDDDE